jgi:hypothetical protein
LLWIAPFGTQGNWGIVLAPFDSDAMEVGIRNLAAAFSADEPGEDSRLDSVREAEWRGVAKRPNDWGGSESPTPEFMSGM